MCFNALRRNPISPSNAIGDPRLTELKEWIETIGAVAGSDPVPASGDASFRRYFRLQKGGESFIVMDAPPANEDCLPFVEIAGYLESMQLNAPRVVEANLENGFLLLTDLGDEQYLDRLVDAPHMADVLYYDAMSALSSLQRSGRTFQSLLPPYDESLLRFELSLFRDWLCGTHLELVFGDDDERSWQDCCDLLVRNAQQQPKVFVHRDYHSRNLMVMRKDNPGILDFQDAVEGPLTYDLVSLLKDCYVEWPAGQVQQWARNFYLGLDDETRTAMTEQQFFQYFDLMGVQRQLKAAGIFCRLNHRDGKSGYLADVPRTLNYIVNLRPRHKELNFLVRLIEELILPMWESTN